MTAEQVVARNEAIRQDAVALAILADVRVIAVEVIWRWANTMVQELPTPSHHLCELATVSWHEDIAVVRELLVDFVGTCSGPPEVHQARELIYNFFDVGQHQLRGYPANSALWRRLFECLLEVLRAQTTDARLVAAVLDQMSGPVGWPNQSWADAYFEAGDADYGRWYPTKELIVSVMNHELSRCFRESDYPRPFEDIARAHYDTSRKVFNW